MDYQFATILTGFIAVLFTIVNSNNSLRKELKDDINKEISRLDADIKALSVKLDNEINAVNAKLDTLIMALFKQNLNIPQTPPENKDAA